MDEAARAAGVDRRRARDVADGADRGRRRLGQPARWQLPYATDGLVIKVDSHRAAAACSARPRARRAGRSRTSSPPSRRPRSCSQVEWNVGRTGAITPLGHFEPVELSGTTVKRASFFNCNQIKRLDVAVGDRVLIEKAGEIIPYVITVVERGADRKPVVEPTRLSVVRHDAGARRGAGGAAAAPTPSAARCSARARSSSSASATR